MNVTGLAAGIASLFMLIGCGVEQTSLSQIQRDARVVLRAELSPDSSGDDGADLTHEYSKFDGISGARADGGDTLAVFLSPEASEDELDAVKQALSRDSRVERVSVERRD
jgi:hypothetical protein